MCLGRGKGGDWAEMMSDERENGKRADLLPGRAAKTARSFSCLRAMWALRKASSWERKAASVSGSDGSAAARCHWAGFRSRTTERWERSIDNMYGRF